MTPPTTPTERVGRYQLLEPIGVGPSGAVSRAKVFGVAGFERQFAIKRFHAELTATSAMAAMLSAAARAYGSLEHPRIARMSEFGVAQGSTFTAVEYVPGLDALRLLAEVRLASGTAGGLAAGGALALVSQAARAVGYAHGRGLTHLGLSPTNVIVTADGDIKITDFGILSATLPPRPLEAPRLAQRIPYLAPEQLANEATSAATDVFALGVLAYELVTGTRTFQGDTPQQVASAIMAGPPGEPALPRPIVRVLQRCMARSPFERFPDARALADALDAALRVAPVPGTRKDIGAQVKEALDRLAALNEGQLSGMVALHLGTGPIRRLDADASAAPARRDGRAASEGGSAPYELSQPDLGGAAASFGSAPPTLSDLPRSPMTTVPGLAPPPIPVPPGVVPPAIPSPPGPPSSGTLVGLGKTPPALPTVKRPGSVGGIPAVLPSVRRPTRPEIEVPAPPTEARPPLTLESAVHTLDPSDLLSFEPGDDGHGEDAPDEASHAQAAASREPARPAEPATVRLAGPPAQSPSRARQDPSSFDTKPIPRVALEPLLSDPSARPAVRADARAEADGHGDGDGWDDASAGDGTDDAAGEGDGDAPSERAATAAMPSRDSGPGRPAAAALASSGSGRITASGPASAADAGEPPPGRTILGIPMAGSPARATPPAPFPPAPSAAPSAAAADGPERGPFDGSPGGSGGDGPDEPERFPAAAMDGGAEPASRPSSPAGWITAPAPSAAAMAPPVDRTAAPASAWRVLWAVGGVLALGVSGLTAWKISSTRTAPPAGRSPVVAAAPADARPALAPADAAPDGAQLAAAAAPADAAAGAPSGSNAGSAAPARAPAVQPPGPAVAPTSPTAPTAPVASPAAASDRLSIASTPPGARVFLDGADAGTTPLKLPGSPDRHTIALLLAGHELYVAQVDGHGSFQIPLKEVTPSNGPAGIKVLRCKEPERYYVFIDGKPTGQTCPTERIGCEVGPHTVETYDVVSETRRKWDIVVKDTRLSFRVRVE